MGSIVDTDDLVSAAEVAEMLGLAQYNSVTTYLNRYETFPRPVVDMSGGHIRLWLRQDVQSWSRGREAAKAESRTEDE